MARGGGRGGGAGRGGRGGGGGGSGGDLNAELDNLDTLMLGRFYQYVNSILPPWQEGAWNNGQIAIIEQHITPAIREHVQKAKEEWPWSGDPDELLASIYGCYDPDVIDRAFNDTINNMYDHIMTIWIEADGFMHEHWDIAPNKGPHATNPPWT